MDRRIRKTKQAIVTAFLELLDEKKDIDKISITDITKRADISRSTFYFHYNGTYELVDEICDTFTKEIYNIVIKAHTDISSESGYLNMYNEILSYLYENRTTTRLLLKSPKEADMTKKICDDIYKLLTVYYLSKRQQVGKDVLNITALFSTYGILSIIREWVDSDFRHTPQEMADITYQAIQTAVDFFQEYET